MAFMKNQLMLHPPLYLHNTMVFTQFNSIIDQLPTTLNDPIEITDEVYEEDSITSLGQFETKRRMLTMKQLQTETIKDNINQKLRTYWNMYSELKAVLKSNSTKLTQKQFEFVMNYFIAKKDFYAEIKAELGKISRVNET
ncbi:uncharacterized protein LOC123554957 [Mercenaria mercenaria]|uniref:uncharacterized protein LOC123554957 n=1 Tax=Mercenaria mercenaria TaxID=6596 RepID=UPI00234F9E69|nr:uncharacterized protein LOC123554957 [Mercenaria mercenaria]